MATELVRYSFTVDEYERMAKTGIFPDDVRTELLEGDIVTMPPIGERHAGYVARLDRLLGRCFEDLGIVVWPQNPVVMRPRSEPEPDLCLLRPRADDYVSAKPTPTDILLVIEVADSSLVTDRGLKATLYARHGIPEYWVVDIEHRRVEISREPTSEGYASRTTVESGPLVPSLVPDRSIAFEDIFR